METIRDITERNRQEILLRENEACLRHITDNMLDIVYETDNDGIITYVSPSCQSTLGVKPEVILGSSAFNLIHPEDRSNVITRFLSGISSASPGKVEYRYNHSDGRCLWIEAIGKPLLDDQGRVNGAVFGCRDITERKLAEESLAAEKERLRVTLRSIGDGVIATDVKGDIILINSAAEAITAWKHQEAHGKPLKDVIKLLEQSSTLTPFMDPAAGQTSEETERKATIEAKDGSSKIIAYSFAAIKNEKAAVIGSVLVFRDITSLKKVEVQQAFSQKMEAIGQLAAGIAHEINSPMQYIGDNTRFLQEAFQNLSNFCNWLMEQNASHQLPSAMAKELRKFAKEIDLEYLLREIPEAFEHSIAGIEGVRKLVLAMKDFSHPGSKKKALVDLNQAIMGTVTMSRNQWKYIGELELKLDPSLPFVYCVANEINQVILNMIMNSADAIEDAIQKGLYTQGKILVETKYQPPWVLITVEDNGIGIPAAVMHRIFDPFFTTKDVGKGTGQGMAIAHDIVVNKHQGNIAVESKVGQGTRFTISLLINENAN